MLLVGTYKGVAGQFTTIQAAVNAAKPGDWILIAPGDYHEIADQQTPPTPEQADEGDVGGVEISTPNLHLVGLDRNSVIVDGDNPGTAKACDPNPADQDFGVKGPDGKPYGRNGIVIFKADNVSVDNLTICNFLAGHAASGNEIWWNGGDETGKVAAKGYVGRYLTATSTYFGSEDTAAQYGIFSSNTAGPGTWYQTYASNMNDSGMYVGACLQVCRVGITHAWMEYNALGYSGTNSGGAVVIANSQFDHNQDGLDTNTQIAGDPPAPQNGACPDGRISPITHTNSCWVFMDNYVHDNNNPNVPAAGAAAAGPYGTGMTVSGGRNDTVVDNQFSNNGAWGVLFVPYPDSGTPSLAQSCPKTGGVETPGFGCVYDPEGDALLGNHYRHNGYFGNPSNSDFGQITLDKGQPQNCFAGNLMPDGSAPANLEQIQPTCGAITTAGNSGGSLLAQVLCDTGFGTCPAGANYPKPTKIVMHPIPSGLPTDPNPCQGVPTNAWCPWATDEQLSCPVGDAWRPTMLGAPGFFDWRARSPAGPRPSRSTVADAPPGRGPSRRGHPGGGHRRPGAHRPADGVAVERHRGPGPSRPNVLVAVRVGWRGDAATGTRCGGPAAGTSGATGLPAGGW